MKYWYEIILLSVAGLMSFVIYVQAENNNQLIYDLNVSQTAFMILKHTIEVQK